MNGTTKGKMKGKSGLARVRRSSIREQLHDQIRDRIAALGIPPSTAVREADLARQAGVSRTPVREALLLLEAEGFVQSSNGRGFFTPPLRLEEAEETYPILAGLECLALRQSGVPPESVLAQLDDFNATLGRTEKPETCLDLDDRWHALLLTGSGNGTLRREIARMKALVRRYEIAYMQDRGRIATSVRQHEEILRQLRARRLPAAARALERNWSITFEQLAPWIRSRVRSGDE